MKYVKKLQETMLRFYATVRGRVLYGFQDVSSRKSNLLCFRHINAAENHVLAAVTAGEGWHNYHHTFPWDYKSAELGYRGLNFTTTFIDFFAYIGWAYDLKQPNKELVQRVVQQLGDGSHTKWGHLKEVPEEGEQLKDNIQEMLFKAEEKAKGT